MTVQVVQQYQFNDDIELGNTALQWELNNIQQVINNANAGLTTWDNIKVTALTATNAPTFTNPLSIASGGTASGTTLNNNRFIVSSGSKIVEASAVTASKAVASDANGLPTASITTSTELGYIHALTGLSATLGSITTADSMNGAFGKLINARIAQIVFFNTNSPSTISASSFTNTNLTASITPTATTSKILILASSAIENDTSGVNAVYTLKRGSTNLGDTTWGMGVAGMTNANTTQAFYPVSLIWFDNPSTTSSTTYTVAAKSDGTHSIFFGTSATPQQSIVLIEIALGA